MILFDKKELLGVLDNFLLVASQVGTLFLMMGVGYVLTKIGKFSRETLSQVTYLLLYVVVPCLMMDTLQIPRSTELMRVMGLCMALTLGLYLLMALVVNLFFRRQEEDTRIVLRYGVVYGNTFDNAKTDITDADKDRLIASLKQLNEGENIESVVDVDEVIRYFVVHNFVCNFDSYTGSMIHNYYLYEEDGQLSMIPWDYNLAFGGFQGGQDATSMVNYPIDTPVSGGTVDSRPMLAWIFESEEYTQLYHQYFADFISSYFDSGYFTQMMAQTKQLIAPYVEKDPTKFCTYEEFETGIETLEQFCLLRAESVQGQLDGTIPSTSDGQAEDSSALVDASELSISDMGTMNNAMGGGMGGPMEREDISAQPQGEEVPSGGQPFDLPVGEDSASLPMDGNVPERPQANTAAESGQDPMKLEVGGENQSALNREYGVLLAASAAVLLAGLILAWRYRKRA